MARILPSDLGFRGEFTTEVSARQLHSGAAGIIEYVPTAVAIPDDAADVATLLRWADRTRTPIVPRGAATGMPGGNVGPGVAVDLVRSFGAIGAIDDDDRTVRVEPGVTRGAINRAALPLGLRFPVDPSSGNRCTIGGMIANNAAGAHSVRYGATRSWVSALDLVLADGSPATIRRGIPPSGPIAALLADFDDRLLPRAESIRARWPKVRKNSSGYALDEYLASGDAIDLMVGSEGTLALITAAELRLAPLPRSVGLLVAEFRDLDAATRAVAELLPHRPLTCEILDRTFLDLVRDGGGDDAHALRPGLECILLVEIEGDDAAGVQTSIDAALDAIRGLASGSTTAVDPVRVEHLWEIRHAASPIIARNAGSRVSMQFIEDSVVPLESLPDYVRGLRSILDRHALPAVIFGHAGDGNLHVNPLVDVSDPGWRDTVRAVLDETADLVARLGGTLAGEHGDGRVRAPYLETIWGSQTVDSFRTLKNLFDPRGLLNPGVILPLPDQDPLAGVRKFA